MLGKESFEIPRVLISERYRSKESWKLDREKGKLVARNEKVLADTEHRGEILRKFILFNFKQLYNYLVSTKNIALRYTNSVTEYNRIHFTKKLEAEK